jgi:hypothetical protein
VFNLNSHEKHKKGQEADDGRWEVMSKMLDGLFLAFRATNGSNLRSAQTIALCVPGQPRSGDIN